MQLQVKCPILAGMDGKPCDSAVRAWTRLVRAEQAVLGDVEERLKRAGFPPLAWYDVLLELARAEDGRLTQSELQRRVLLAQYNVSRLVDRMERKGLVRRAACAADARCKFVAVTEQGRRLQRRMWPVYANAIETHLGSRLSAGEAATLGDLLERLLAPPRPPQGARSGVVSETPSRARRRSQGLGR
jgi:DNA-binding MarR family transcriptional regulator